MNSYCHNLSNAYVRALQPCTLFHKPKESTSVQTMRVDKKRSGKVLAQEPESPMEEGLPASRISKEPPHSTSLESRRHAHAQRPQAAPLFPQRLGFTSGSLGFALHKPAGVALGFWVLVVSSVPASAVRVVGGQVSRGRVGKKGDRGGGGGRETGWVVAPLSGLCAETGTRYPVVWGPGSVEAGRRVGSGTLGLWEGLPIFLSFPLWRLFS